MRWIRLVCVALSVLAVSAVAVPARAATPTYYVSLGDSLAAGYMPGGAATNHGYADDTYRALKATHPTLRLVKLGCTGETTQTLIDGGICKNRYAGGNQLAAAVAFLTAHRGAVTYLSLDIGANDVSKCAQSGTVDLGCAATSVVAVTTNLTTILGRLHAADPAIGATVGLTYYDPYLAAALLGASGAQAAAQTLLLQQAINLVETGVYGAYGYRVGDVATAFHSAEVTPRRTLPSFGSQPANVAFVCTYTHICTDRDIHPTVAGYAIIAKVLQAEFA